MQSIPYVNLLPSSLLASFITEEMKAKVLLMCTVESGKFAYSLISNPAITALNLAKMTPLQIEEEVKKVEVEYHSVEVDLNTEFENKDEELRSILSDWCMIDQKEQQKESNNVNENVNQNMIVRGTRNLSKNPLFLVNKNVKGVNNSNLLALTNSKNNNSNENDEAEMYTPEIPQIEETIINNKQMKLITNYIFTFPANELMSHKPPPPDGGDDDGDNDNNNVYGDDEKDSK
jgi:hypothetical protein